MPPPRHVVITAAGIGSRLGMNLPKCLVTVCGRCIIDYQLDLLADVEDVRIVVGFKRDLVIRHVRERRSDVTFVLNHAYASTTVLESLALGARGLREPFVALDGDVVPEPDSFRAFLRSCEQHVPLTSFCEAASSQPVYANIDDVDGESRLVALRREPESAWEWPGISYLHPIMIEARSTFVYEQIVNYLPVRAVKVRCWEIDTPDDMQQAELALARD